MLDASKDKLTKKDVLHTCHVDGAVSVLRTDKPAVTHQTFQQVKGTSLYRQSAFLTLKHFFGKWAISKMLLCASISYILAFLTCGLTASRQYGHIGKKCLLSVNTTVHTNCLPLQCKGKIKISECKWKKESSQYSTNERVLHTLARLEAHWRTTVFLFFIFVVLVDTWRQRVDRTNYPSLIARQPIAVASGNCHELVCIFRVHTFCFSFFLVKHWWRRRWWQEKCTFARRTGVSAPVEAALKHTLKESASQRDDLCDDHWMSAPLSLAMPWYTQAHIYRWLMRN